jgi:hypothetical protein
MTLKDTTSIDHIQPVRRVNENEQLNSGSATTTNIIHLTYYPDPSTGKDILLWDDILAAFKEDVVHVRSGVRVLPFLKGSDFKKYIVNLVFVPANGALYYFFFLASPLSTHFPIADFSASF